MSSFMDPNFLRNPDLYSNMAAPILASEPIRGEDGRWHWGSTNIDTEARRKLATSIKAQPKRGSIAFHRRFSGANMDPAIREHFRMNRHQLEYMQNERKELLRLAAIHQLERERREMIEEEQRAVKMREIQIAEELERKKIAEKLAADRRYLGKIPIKPDMNRKIPKYTKPRKKTPTFQKTTSTPKGSSPMQNQHRRISNNNTLSGRQAKAASDHADVQRAHAKTNRVTLTK